MGTVMVAVSRVIREDGRELEFVVQVLAVMPPSNSN